MPESVSGSVMNQVLASSKEWAGTVNFDGLSVDQRKDLRLPTLSPRRNLRKTGATRAVGEPSQADFRLIN